MIKIFEASFTISEKHYETYEVFAEGEAEWLGFPQKNELRIVCFGE